jgi:thiol:disulfide interchange protein
METLIALIGIAVVLLGLIIYDAFSYGFLFLKLYTWFLLPVFPMMPVIGFWEAVGLAFFTCVFRRPKSHKNKDEEIDWTNLFTPWVVLLIAWILHAWFF